MQQKLQAQPVYLIDGSDMESGPITHQTNIRIHAANHTEEITFEETTLGGFPIILGLPWLKKHNPEIGWKTHEIRFNSEYCQNNCMNVGTTVEDIKDEEAFIQKQLRPEDISLISATAFKRAARLHQQKKSAASVTSLEKGIAFSPLWPLWPLWCLCVASVEKRHCVLSSMKKKQNFIEECKQCLFSKKAKQRH